MTALALCALLGAACGGSEKRVAQPGEFSTRHAVLFDDGIDLIEDPDSLQGRWRSDWELELDERLQDADLVASGTVTTLREEINPEQRATYHLLFRVRKAYKGKPNDKDVSLAAREGASGFSSVQQHREHMIERDLVMFVRYAKDDKGAITPHFHLMPPSPAVTHGVQRYETMQNPNRIVVIEHKQEK